MEIMEMVDLIVVWFFVQVINRKIAVRNTNILIMNRYKNDDKNCFTNKEHELYHLG